MLSFKAAARRHVLIPHLRRSTRHQLHTQTVTDGDIARLASKSLHPLTLADLCKHGRSPLSEQNLFDSANFTLDILPARLAHRIQSLRSLPYIVVSNPNVTKIHNYYVHSLSTLLPYADHKIETIAEEIRFTEVMADLVQTHANTIAILARGFLEARKYIGKDEITRYLDEHLRARIGTRLIAEQHIALHFSSQPHAELSESRSSSVPDTYIGVIDTALKPIDVIHTCEHIVGEICELKYGVRPTVRVIGSLNTTIAHIPMHLEYVITELLKNSFRATIEAGMEKEPIEITIAPSPATVQETARMKSESAPPATFSAASSSTTPSTAAISNYDQGSIDMASGNSDAESANAAASSNIRALDTQTPGVTIRIRDRGGGISPENAAKLWEYGFTTFNEDEIVEASGGGTGGYGDGSGGLDAISAGPAGGSSLAGLGYGLPLGRAYAEYFGGGIAVQSLWGWGTDVYLSLRGVGNIAKRG